MAQFAGTYESVGIDNGEEFYKALGLPEPAIKPLLVNKPLQITVNGNEFVIQTGHHKQEFTLGVEYSEAFAKHYIGKSTTVLEANKLVTKCLMPEGHYSTRTTELLADGTLIHENRDPRTPIVLRRTYKKL